MEPSRIGRALSLPLRRGLTGTYSTLRYHFLEWWTERALGIRTTDTSGDGKRAPDGGIEYEPLSYECLRTIFSELGPEASDVFLDYGCGLGRAVVLAATYPFAAVIGVEYQADLVERAKENVSRSRGRHRCQHVEIVHGDATAYEVPDDVSIVYLFNPFTGDMMEAVQERLRESLDRVPRRLRIVYMTPPDQPDLFERVPWLQVERTLPTGHWDGCRLAVYASSDAN